MFPLVLGAGKKPADELVAHVVAHEQLGLAFGDLVVVVKLERGAPAHDREGGPVQQGFDPLVDVMAYPAPAPVLPPGVTDKLPRPCRAWPSTGAGAYSTAPTATAGKTATTSQVVAYGRASATKREKATAQVAAAYYRAAARALTPRQYALLLCPEGREAHQAPMAFATRP